MGGERELWGGGRVNNYVPCALAGWERHERGSHVWFFKES